MRIGLVVQAFDPSRGGAEQWNSQYASALLAAGHEVHVVAAHVPSQSATPNLHVHRVECGSGRLAFAAAAEDTLRRLPVDVIHDSGYGWHYDVLQPHGGSRHASFEQNLLLAPRWMRPIKRRTARWLPRYREFNELLRRQYASRHRIVVAISRMVSGHLQQYHDVRPEQIRLVYNGVDVDRFTPAHRGVHREPLRQQLGVRDDEVLLLIVAHNFRLKGVHTLLHSMVRLSRAGYPVKLAVVGGRRLHPWQAMVERLGIAPQVRLVGSVDDAPRYYAAADVYVQPTFYDPCSLVVLEALASGLPVVTSRFNGAGELIEVGREGSLVDDPANAEELADALELMMDTSVRTTMGEAARTLAMNHTFQRNCRELLHVYQEVTQVKRAA